jgi:HNH endonuclease/AP2 domain
MQFLQEKKKGEILINQIRLKELLHYNQKTGIFIWKSSRKYIRSGTKAGSPCRAGYTRIKVDGRLYGAHRLAWLYMTGQWPRSEIDHRNGDRGDNRIENLREATPGENCQNIAIYKNNTSGFIGVSWCERISKWRAGIRINKKQIWIGSYASPEAAHTAYCKAKTKHHKFNPTIRSIDGVPR